MNDSIIVIVGLIVSLITIITPIIKLNTNITKLNMAVVSLNESMEDVLIKIENHEKRLLLLENYWKASDLNGNNHS